MRSFCHKYLIPYRAGLLIAYLLLCSLSCVSYGSQKNSPEGLGVALKAFNTTIRWGDYKTAAAFFPPAQQARFWQTAEEFSRKVRIVDFEIRQGFIEPESQTGIGILSFRYYYTNDPNLRTRTIQQKWVYRDQPKGWRVSDDGLADLLKPKE